MYQNNLAGTVTPLPARQQYIDTEISDGYITGTGSRQSTNPTRDAAHREIGTLTVEDRPTDTRGRIPVDLTGWRDGEPHGTFDSFLPPDLLLAMFRACVISELPSCPDSNLENEGSERPDSPGHT